MANPYDFRKVEVLLVEDNPADVRLTVEAFREAHIAHHLSVAHDGEEALRFLRREGEFSEAPHPDLVLLDLNLPKKSGREVLAEMQDDKALRGIPVIVLTTSPADSDIRAAYDLHANCYITKPVDLDQFLRVVQSIENFWFHIVALPNP